MKRHIHRHIVVERPRPGWKSILALAMLLLMLALSFCAAAWLWSNLMESRADGALMVVLEEDPPRVTQTQQQLIIEGMLANLKHGRSIDINHPRTTQKDIQRRQHAGHDIAWWMDICAHDLPAYQPCIAFGCAALEEQWPWIHEQCRHCEN